MLKTSKQNKRAKTNSSYMLSGINIVKMVTEDPSLLDAEASETNISKIEKAPILKYPRKQKDPNYDVLNLPSKSFKIRSFTKKVKDVSNIKEDQSCEIFEKMDCVRNLRAINSRVEAFNLSRMTAQGRAHRQNPSRSITANIYSKMREIFKRDASMKCKVGSQIFVRQAVNKTQRALLPLEYDIINTEPFRDLSNKCHISYSQKAHENEQKDTLLIVSVEAVKVNSRKMFKQYEETKFNRQSNSLSSQQTWEIIKIIFEQEIQNQSKISFKVNDQRTLDELKNFLDHNHFRYHSIFYPISRHCEPWNLYNIDFLLTNTQKVILVENVHTLTYEFPILNYAPTIMIGTNHESFFTLSQIILGLQTYLNQAEPSQHLQSQQQQIQVVEQQFQRHNFQSSKMCILSCDFKEQKQKSELAAKKGVPHQFSLKEDKILINSSQIYSYIVLLQQNKQIKAQKQKKQNNKQRGGSHELKRRALCERSTNIIEENTVSQNQKSEKYHLKSMQQLGEELMDHARQILPAQWRTPNRTARNNEYPEKNEDLDDIMNNIKGNCSQTKPVLQQVAQLIRRNNNIYKQITQYMTSNRQITLPEPSSQAHKLHNLQFRVNRIS